MITNQNNITLVAQLSYLFFPTSGISRSQFVTRVMTI